MKNSTLKLISNKYSICLWELPGNQTLNPIKEEYGLNYNSRSENSITTRKSCFSSVFLKANSRRL